MQASNKVMVIAHRFLFGAVGKVSATPQHKVFPPRVITPR
jgi:hypothetical protein